VSTESADTEIDLHAITDADAAAKSGVEHGEALLRFAEAVYSRDEKAMRPARTRVLDAVGPEGLVSAAGVVGNFQRMVRIADSTGIPLDTPLEIVSGDIREDLDLQRFGSSANTPAGGALKRALTPVLRPLLRRAFAFVGGRMMRQRKPETKTDSA